MKKKEKREIEKYRTRKIRKSGEGREFEGRKKVSGKNW